VNLGTRRWKRVREYILNRDDYTCRVLVDPRSRWPSDAGDAVECGEQLDPGKPVGHNLYPVVDHIVTREDGGSDGEDNLRAASWKCNGRRAAMQTNARKRPVNVTREL